MKPIQLLMFFIFISLRAQGLFDDAVAGSTDKTEAASGVAYELNGFIRGVFFGGKNPDDQETEMKSGYAETGLKLRIRKESFGDAYAEIRFREGNEFGEPVSQVEIREAYIDIYTGKLDFQIGHQIVVWGRADGFNPTNNLTPQNMLVRSSDEDDRREGNFLFRSFLNLHPFRIEAAVIPVYAASVVPVDLIPLPAGITLAEQEPLDTNLEHFGLAFKLDVELPSFDGSLSYFSGYNPMPGIVGAADGLDMIVRPKPFRVKMIGADFSTTIGSFGMRGELAYRDPEGKYETKAYIPNPDFHYILGIDKQWGDFSLILQYIGRKVMDFIPLDVPPDPEADPVYQINQKNRMLASQLDEISHAFSFRPALTLMHETMTAECSGLYNLTTEELMLRPKLSYDIADALTVTVGGEIYSGPDDTLFGIIDEVLSAFFMELKTSF